MPDTHLPHTLTHALAAESSVNGLRDRLRQDYQDCRAVTLQQFASVDDALMATQAHPDFSPTGWHLGHIGYTESLWLLEHCGGFQAQCPQYNLLLAADGLPKEQRQNLPPLDEFRQYLAAIRRQTLDYLTIAPLKQQERLWHFILQHESQHGETIAIVLALLNHHPPIPPPSNSPPPPERSRREMVHVPAGSFTMGYDGADALDNERPAHLVDLDDYWIDAYPVTCGEFADFIEAGGYHDSQWWTDEGWQWKVQHNICQPLYWPEPTPSPSQEGERSVQNPLAQRPEGLAKIQNGEPTPNPSREGERSVQNPKSKIQNGEPTPSPSQEGERTIQNFLPVCGVSWYEANAYANFVGKRLPTEAEWEKAARWHPKTGNSTHYPWGNESPLGHHANHQHLVGHLSPVNAHPEGKSAVGCWDLMGNVWEWTSDWFAPYDGFTPYPYKGYSQAYFDQQHRVLRGGSWATRRWGLRSSFRNWYHPHVRQIFAGFRCAKS